MTRKAAWQVIGRRSGTMRDADLFPGCFVLVTCGSSGHSKPYNPSRIVMRLRELRLGGALATFEQIAGRIEKRCRCGVRDWRAELAYPAHMSSAEVKRLQARARN